MKTWSEAIGRPVYNLRGSYWIEANGDLHRVVESSLGRIIEYSGVKPIPLYLVIECKWCRRRPEGEETSCKGCGARVA